MKIKERPKKKKRWNPDEQVERQSMRLPQLNKYFLHRRLYGFGS